MWMLGLDGGKWTKVEDLLLDLRVEQGRVLPVLPWENLPRAPGLAAALLCLSPERISFPQCELIRVFPSHTFYSSSQSLLQHFPAIPGAFYPCFPSPKSW